MQDTHRVSLHSPTTAAASQAALMCTMHEAASNRPPARSFRTLNPRGVAGTGGAPRSSPIVVAKIKKRPNNTFIVDWHLMRSVTNPLQHSCLQCVARVHEGCCYDSGMPGMLIAHTVRLAVLAKALAVTQLLASPIADKLACWPTVRLGHMAAVGFLFFAQLLQCLAPINLHLLTMC
jgi:hypothetical protein